MSLLVLVKILIFFITMVVTASVSFIGIPIAVLFLVIAVIHYWQYGAVEFDGSVLLIMTITTIFAVFLDNFVLAFGLKKTDASRKGYIGAFIGSFAGLFTGTLSGFIFFGFIGAVLGELIHGKGKKAISTGIAASLSILFGAVIRSVITLALAAYVTFHLLF